MRALGHAAGWLLVLLGAASGGAHGAVPGTAEESLQARLDRTGALELESNRDYAATGRASLIVRSGQRIVGGWNTHVPRILIPGGSHGISILGIRGAGGDFADIVFGAGAPTTDVEIVGGNGGQGGGAERLKVELEPGSQVERLALTEFGGLRVLHGREGHVRDSVFSRLISYWRGPVLRWEGNPESLDRGNAFLGMSLVTPQSGASFRDVGDLWLVGWDCESWNSESQVPKPCFEVSGANHLVGIGLSGGTAYPGSGGPLLRLNRIGELATFFLHGHGGARGEADIEIDGVDRWLDFQDAGTSTVHDRGSPDATSRRFVGAAATRAAQWITPARLDVEIGPSPPSRIVPLARLRDIAEPPDVPPRSPDGRDDAAWIQARLDTRHLVSLPPGTYVLQRSLRLGARDRVEGLIGPRDGTAVLRANGDFPIIRGRAQRRAPGSAGQDIRLVLEGLTLVGGSQGISWSGDADDLGPRSTVAWSTFRDLRFLRQRVAAVQATGIAGLDSNLWYRVDVRDVPIAFSGVGSGTGPGMNYADKQLFLDCQFQRVGDVVWSWLTDRSSGGEVWQQDYFKDVGQLTRTRAATNLLWFATVFDGVQGPKGIEIVDRGATGTGYFYVVDGLWRGVGPSVVTDTQPSRTGTLFINTEFAQRGGALVEGEGAALSAWSSWITGSVDVGPVRTGAFVESRLGRFDRRLTVVDDGRTTMQINQPAVGVQPAPPGATHE